MSISLDKARNPGIGNVPLQMRSEKSQIFKLFSSKSFIVSGLTFRTLMHFEFIFVYNVRKCSHFILLHVTI